VLAPHDPTAIQNLAAAHEQLGQFAEAAEYFRRLVAAYPDDWRNWRMYAAALLVVGDWETAAGAYAEAAERNPAEAEPYYGRAVAVDKLGRPAEAKVELAKATAANPDWPAAVLASARGTVLNERLRAIPEARRSALTWAELGIRYKADLHPKDHDTAGLCYAAEGEFEKAAEQSHWALLATPTGPWGSLHRDRLRYYREKRVPWE
jgi:tetratricopeptide (TPR) repeat protein